MFEQTFVDGVGKTNKSWTVTVSFILELAVIGLLVILPLIFTDVLPKAQLVSLLREQSSDLENRIAAETQVLGAWGALLAIPLTLFVKAMLVDMEVHSRWVITLLSGHHDADRDSDDADRVDEPDAPVEAAPV